jgi:hypothetical protein
MVGDRTASVIALGLVVVAGVIWQAVRHAQRDEVLPASKARELTQRLARSHENLRKQARKR